MHLREITHVAAQGQDLAPPRGFQGFDGANTGGEAVSGTMAAQVRVPLGARRQGLARQERNAGAIVLHQMRSDGQANPAIPTGQQVVAASLQRQLLADLFWQGRCPVALGKAFVAAPCGLSGGRLRHQFFEETGGDRRGFGTGQQCGEACGRHGQFNVAGTHSDAGHLARDDADRASDHRLLGIEQGFVADLRSTGGKDTQMQRMRQLGFCQRLTKPGERQHPHGDVAIKEAGA